MGQSMWLSLVALLHLAALANAVAVMSVDLGSEWIKVAIVSPGVPMEIALNKESKRKSPTAVAFRSGERMFGEDALNMGVRFPQSSYSYLVPLLGQLANSSAVQRYSKQFPHYRIEEDPERGSVVFRHDEETVYSPEELVAMLLQQARKDAEDAANQPITEVVLTVPGYFGQAGRRALQSAAALAGLKPLQLINDYLAVALNYGIFRRKDFNETVQYVMFYDMGATSTSATIVGFSVGKGRDADPQVAVLGVGLDRTLGGLEMQLRLRDFLGEKFNELKKTPNDVFKNPRALAKLFKEAGRLKNVLSANNDHYAQVEGLLDDKDFRLQVTREQFEELCADLIERAAAPVHMALKSSGMSMDIISQVVLVGAGTRVPKVQEILTQATGLTLSKNINADEAAAMGAVYKAADLSAGFKVKRFITKDAVLYPIQVVFDRKVETDNTEQVPATKTVRRTLFGLMNPYPQKKLLTFNRHSQDFSFKVNYAELDHLGPAEIEGLGSLNLSHVELTGISTALGKLSGPGVEAKGVKAHFVFDESGLLSLAGAELSFEKTVTEEKDEEEKGDSPLSKLGNTISKLFSAPNEDEEKPEAAAGEAEQPESPPTSTPAQPQVNDTVPIDAPKPKVTIIKESLTVVEEKLDLNDLAGTQLKASRKKLATLDEADQKRQHHEGALNALESFVLDTRMRLETQEFIQAGSESEREALGKLLSAAGDWLDEEAAGAETEEFEKRLGELSQGAGPLLARVEEHRTRPEALAALDKLIEGSKRFVAAAQNQSAQAEEQVFTEVEMTSIAKVIEETQDWKTKQSAEQAKLSLSQDPKLTVKAIAEKMAILDREVKYLVNKAKIWRPKKPKEEKPTKEKISNQTEQDEKVLSDAAANETTPAPDPLSIEGKEEDETLSIESEEMTEDSAKISPEEPEEEQEEEETLEKDSETAPEHEEL